MEIKRIVCALLCITLVGCSNNKPVQELKVKEDGCLLHIGVVTDEVGVDDNAFYQGVWQGIEQFSSEVENMDQSCYSYYLATNEREYLPYLTQLAEEDYDLIIGADYAFGNAIEEIARFYPDKRFVIIDNEVDSENVASVRFKSEEGSYLAGVAAALKAQELGSNLVGFLGGKSGELIEAFQAGFEEGVYSIHPEMQILIQYTENYHDQDLAEELAYTMFDAGAVVIFHATGDAGIGAINEAKGRENVFVIGVDHDQYEEGLREDGTSVVLTSMIKQVNQATYALAYEVYNQNFTGTLHLFGLADGAIQLELSEGRNLSTDMIATIQEVSSKINNGEIVVGTTPINTYSELDTNEEK